MHVLLAAAFTAIDGIAFQTRVGDGATRALFYRARVRGQALEEAQLLRMDPGGQIHEITLFARPLPALTGLMRVLGPELARGQRRPGLAALLAASTAPLHAATRLGESSIVPLAAPPG